MGSVEQRYVADAQRAWDRGDAVFILSIQGETIWFKKQTNQANAALLNAVVEIGWTLQGTAEKLGGRRVLTFVRTASPARPSEASAGGLADKIAKLPDSKRDSVERLVDEMLADEQPT